MPTPLEPHERTHLSDLLTFLMSAGGGLPLLEQAARDQSPVAINELQTRLMERGLDDETLGAPAEEFLTSFAENFVEELKHLLEKNGVNYDSKYLV